MDNEEKNGAATDGHDPARTAAEALHRAKAELEKAQAFYDQIRQQAAERLKAVRRTSVGDVMDYTLDTVKRHPAAGLTIAALIGYYLGRLFRR